jgi:hypothetical protein
MVAGHQIANEPGFRGHQGEVGSVRPQQPAYVRHVKRRRTLLALDRPRGSTMVHLNRMLQGAKLKLCLDPCKVGGRSACRMLPEQSRTQMLRACDR